MSSTIISIIKTIDDKGNPAVGVVLSQNAFVDISGEPHSGVALSPAAAKEVIAKIQNAVREIEAEQSRS